MENIIRIKKYLLEECCKCPYSVKESVQVGENYDAESHDESYEIYVRKDYDLSGNSCPSPDITIASASTCSYSSEKRDKFEIKWSCSSSGILTTAMQTQSFFNSLSHENNKKL